MGLFSSKLIDPYTAEWQFEHFAFLFTHLILAFDLPRPSLRLPTRETFLDPNNPEVTHKGEALAKHILNSVKIQIGIGQHPIDLKPTTETKPKDIGGSVILQTDNQHAAAGRYIVEKKDNGEYEEYITYDEDSTSNPEQLVATLAHELSHYLHNRMPELPEFEENLLYEMFTDLTAVFLGYGVFLGNTKFHYEQTSEQWSSRSTGYLSESELMFATAIFLRVHELEIEPAKQHLKPHLWKMLDKALKQLNRYTAEIEELQNLAQNHTHKWDRQNPEWSDQKPEQPKVTWHFKTD